ncbi:hypothetical protein R8Z57_11460 [Microbacterium sp. M3]|uniref:Uncharacterized protein n=1 Tax=Microbacterium arthrosphaerae TaxID=792652 RepID=A0ABU4H223_9MICO|nr:MULTISPECIES: hypothetical protein [Microbacterium]MDW4573388.1 hypothetical protein [Microbacterium arthrosphaerae]MDW7607243.1 hypothetical protein [Microbacterium sp. M3]
MISVKNVLVVLAVAFTAYLAARGLTWGAAPVPQPLIIVVTLAFYLATTWLCIFWEPARRPDEAPVPSAAVDADAASASASGATSARLPDLVERVRSPHRLPPVAQILALACAVIVPSAISLAAGEASRLASFATWYLGGIGALMTIVMVRRRPWTAWTGIVLLAIASMVWMGPLNALALGLVGSIVWVTCAQLLVFSMDRAARDTSRLTRLQRAATAWQTSQVVRQRERRVQVQKALAVAGPVLTRTVAQGGALTDADRLEARIAEGRLRDEMRGPRLLDDDVRAELERARRRGANVTVLDEGGLDDVDEQTLSIIRGQLAETLRSASSDRLYIRTSPDERVAVTVVGRSPSVGGPSDEDAVDLWREIPHPGAG